MDLASWEAWLVGRGLAEGQLAAYRSLAPRILAEGEPTTYPLVAAAVTRARLGGLAEVDVARLQTVGAALVEFTQGSTPAPPPSPQFRVQDPEGRPLWAALDWRILLLGVMFVSAFAIRSCAK